MKKKINTDNSNCNHTDYEQATALSKYVWKLYFTYNIMWRVLARARTYNPATKVCNLCSKEKYYIIFHSELATINEN